MSYRIVNSDSYEGYATLGKVWTRFAPGQVITSEYEPKNETAGISYTKIAPAIKPADGSFKSAPVQSVGVSVVDAIPSRKAFFTSPN